MNWPTHEGCARKGKRKLHIRHNWRAINKAVITGPFFPDDLSTIYASFSSYTGCGKLVVARNVTRKGRDSDLRFLLLETRPPYVLRVQTFRVPYQLTPSRPRRKRFLPSFLPFLLHFFFLVHCSQHDDSTRERILSMRKERERIKMK